MARKSRAKQVTQSADDTAVIEETALEPKAETSAEFDPALKQQADEIVQSVADSTAMPEEKPTGFAERMPKRGPRYNEQGITDKLAGAKLLEHHDPYLSVIRFEEKPSDVVRMKLREAEFRWEAQNNEWARPIRFETRQQDRINAERVFEEVCAQIRSEKGITHNFGGA